MRPTSIQSLDQYDPSLDTINLGVYGHPGIGKTVLAASGGPKTLIMDSDNRGTLSARMQGSKASRISVVDYDTLNEVYDWLANDKHEFTWVWWDSITLFQDRALIDDILVEAHLINPRQSEDVASQREYLVSQNRIGAKIRLFTDLPINFGFTAHVMVGEETEGDGGLVYKPDIRGKKGSFSSFLCGYMNVIGYYGLTTSGKRRLLTERSGEYYAKDRFHALRTGGNAWLDNPTIPMIEDLIDRKKASLNGASAPSPVRRRRRPAATKGEA